MSDESANALAAFLEHADRPAGTLSYHELQGFLFAVATSPELVRPSEWMPVVFGDKEPEYSNLDEAQTILGAMMTVYNDVNASVRSGHPVLPADCRFRRNLLANFEEEAPVSRWSRGFSRGYQWLRDDWDECVPDDFDADFGLLLMVLTFFATEDLASDYVKEMGGTDLATEAAKVRRMFPQTMAEFARIARLIQHVLLKTELSAAPAPPARATAGRNDPCPCGSGRKYKKCCGAPA